MFISCQIQSSFFFLFGILGVFLLSLIDLTALSDCLSSSSGLLNPLTLWELLRLYYLPARQISVQPSIDKRPSQCLHFRWDSQQLLRHLEVCPVHHRIAQYQGDTICSELPSLATSLRLERNREFISRPPKDGHKSIPAQSQLHA